METVMTASYLRAAVQRFQEQINRPIDYEEEKAYKQEWVRRGNLVITGEMESPPLGLGLMSNWKYKRRTA